MTMVSQSVQDFQNTNLNQFGLSAPPKHLTPNVVHETSQESLEPTLTRHQKDLSKLSDKPMTTKVQVTLPSTLNMPTPEI